MAFVSLGCRPLKPSNRVMAKGIFSDRTPSWEFCTIFLQCAWIGFPRSHRKMPRSRLFLNHMWSLCHLIICLSLMHFEKWKNVISTTSSPHTEEGRIGWSDFLLRWLPRPCYFEGFSVVWIFQARRDVPGEHGDSGGAVDCSIEKPLGGPRGSKMRAGGGGWYQFYERR